MQELIIEQVEFCKVKIINPVLIFFAQKNNIYWNFTARTSYISHVLPQYQM